MITRKITIITQFCNRKLYEKFIFPRIVRNIFKIYLASYLPKHYLAFSTMAVERAM